jgi:hypothetical protein
VPAAPESFLDPALLAKISDLALLARTAIAALTMVPATSANAASCR